MQGDHAAHDAMQAALAASTAVLADPPIDVCDVLDVHGAAMWHPSLSRLSAADLVDLHERWQHLAIPWPAREALYAHLAQRYARATREAFVAEVTSCSLQAAVLAWWAPRYGPGSTLLAELQRAATRWTARR
jgi:hypothetical protein